MHLLVALISVLTLLPRSLLVNALDCYAFTAGVANVIIMDSDNGKKDCIDGCDFLKEKVAENRVGETCKAADDYGPWFTYSKNAGCQGCKPGLKGCLCGVEYAAYRMRKEPRPYCSCEAISSRAANPLLGNTPNLYGYCIMGDRNVHCGHRGALELEARADPVTMKTSPPRDLPDSIKWDPKLYVGNDPEILAQVERELAEQENASSV